MIVRKCTRGGLYIITNKHTTIYDYNRSYVIVYVELSLHIHIPIIIITWTKHSQHEHVERFLYKHFSSITAEHHYYTYNQS